MVLYSYSLNRHPFDIKILNDKDFAILIVHQKKDCTILDVFLRQIGASKQVQDEGHRIIALQPFFLTFGNVYFKIQFIDQTVWSRELARTINANQRIHCTMEFAVMLD